MKENNLHHILEELQEIAPLLAEWRKQAAPQLGPLPEGYFEQFPQRLERRREVLGELAPLAPLLAELKLGSPQQGKVPEGYFHSLHDLLMVWQELQEAAPLLASLPKNEKLLGELPEHYFSDFESRLQDKLAEEDQGETPFLDQLSKDKKSLGEVPKGYFEQLEQQVGEKLAAEEPPAATSTPEGRVFQLKPIYVMGAAAAVLILIIAGTWLIRGNGSSPFNYKEMMAMDFHENLRQIPLSEADAYMLANLDEIETDELIENLNEDNVEMLSSFNTGIMPPTDTLPPKKEEKPKPSNDHPSANNQPTVNPNPTKSEAGGLKAELEEDIIEETSLDDLFNQISDSDLDALEAALLGPKTKKSKENTNKQK